MQDVMKLFPEAKVKQKAILTLYKGDLIESQALFEGENVTTRAMCAGMGHLDSPGWELVTSFKVEIFIDRAR